VVLTDTSMSGARLKVAGRGTKRFSCDVIYGKRGLRIGTSGSMSGDGKRGVAEWPKLPRPSSTLPSATSLDVRFSYRPFGSSTFRLSTIAVLMSLAGSRFSSDSPPGPFHHGLAVRRTVDPSELSVNERLFLIVAAAISVIWVTPREFSSSHLH
jgi:hypothetical protein